MVRKAPLVALVAVLTIVLGVGIAKSVGYWKTESSKVPVTITEGEFAGEYDPGDIRGSYSFADIQEVFGVPPEMLAAAFLMTGGNPDVILAKDLETTWADLGGDVEVGTESVRYFTALWTGLPYEPEEDTVLPAAAVEILLAYDKIDTGRAAALMQRAVGPAGGVQTGVTVSEPEAVEDHEIPDRTVRGLTTFGDLSGWGVTPDIWESAFKLPMGSRSTAIKDWSTAEGLSMSEVKSQAQAMVDAAQE
ncbi:MAG: hypothetical protein RQ801_15020 [Spirochaetaceae bacterium]|nr:hypothetical protein [Spirochaetaceae bacterium]MDT8299617.1 hypothetical protein [Spirochaetaceae bacterium]